MKCEQCDETMHRFDNGRISGYCCDDCGWSEDDPDETTADGGNHDT